MTLRMCVVAAGLIAVAGCAGNRGNEVGRLESPEVVALDVENEHWSEVTVFLVHGTVPRRVGTVLPSSKAHFLLPARWLAGNEVRLRIKPVDLTPAWSSDPIDGESRRSMTFRVAPGVSTSARVR